MVSHPRSYSKTVSDADRHKDVVRSPTRKFDLRLILGRGTYTTFPALPDLCPLIPVYKESVSPQIIRNLPNVRDIGVEQNLAVDQFPNLRIAQVHMGHFL